MAKVVEIIRAASEGEAIEQIASLYPTLINYEVLWRRNDSGQFSRRGHNFQISVQFEEADEPAPEDLGDEEY